MLVLPALIAGLIVASNCIHQLPPLNAIYHFGRVRIIIGLLFKAHGRALWAWVRVRR